MKVDKIASVTKNVPLPQEIELRDSINSEIGSVIVVKALEEKPVYNKLELVNGRMSKIIKGDIFVGVLGERKAQGGFVGHVPKTIKKKDTLNVLNLGGVIGKSVSENIEVGSALKVEVLGSLMLDNKHINIKNYCNLTNSLSSSAPIIMISATGMNSGKTTAACKIIKYLHYKGKKIAAAKLTGVALLRDTLNMFDNGAMKTLSFLDSGLPSTVNVSEEKLKLSAKSIIKELNKSNPDYIIIELGDGILGEYGVKSILNCKDIMKFVKCNIVCANDLVGAYGSKVLFDQLHLNIDIITGAVTDTTVGIDYISKELKINSANAKTHPKVLTKLVEKTVSLKVIA